MVSATDYELTPYEITVLECDNKNEWYPKNESR